MSWMRRRGVLATRRAVSGRSAGTSSCRADVGEVTTLSGAELVVGTPSAQRSRAGPKLFGVTGAFDGMPDRLDSASDRPDRLLGRLHGDDGAVAEVDEPEFTGQHTEVLL